MKPIVKSSAITVVAGLLLSTGIAGSATAAKQPLAPEPVASLPVTLDGVLPDGTPYHIAVPENWDGVAVSDLDAARDAGKEEEVYLLDKGYAVIGTGRHPLRELQHDPLKEMANLATVIDMFKDKVGQPTWTIQTGCSGGGFSTLGMAERYPDKIDGAVAFNARGLGGVVVANMWLDLPFALKALLAPDSELPVAPIPIEGRDAALAAWTPVLEEAQKTEVGQARIALAVTAAQWPVWSSDRDESTPKPNPNDLASLQQALFISATDGINSAIGRRALYDNPAGLASWNVGVDYSEFYRNADRDQRDIVTRLYEAAGLPGAAQVETDLAAINAQPRIAPNPAGVKYWLEPGRRLTGDLKVPTLHIHGIGDALLPPALTSGYGDAVHDQKNKELYRQAFIETDGHCTTNLAETVTGLETMVQRLETGEWGKATEPENLNAFGRTFGIGEPRFINYTLPKVLNRAAIPAAWFDISATASSTCTERTAAVNVTVTNNEDMELTVTLDSDLGRESIVVPPKGEQTLSITNGKQLLAGEIAVSASTAKKTQKADQTTLQTVDYDGVTCR